MATFTKALLSGSTNGKAILVTATATTGTTIHTAVAGTSALDEIWIYAVNTSATAVKLTLEWGETAAPQGNIEITIPGECGILEIVPGFPLQNGLVVTAFAGTGSVIALHGYVNKIA